MPSPLSAESFATQKSTDAPAFGSKSASPIAQVPAQKLDQFVHFGQGIEENKTPLGNRVSFLDVVKGPAKIGFVDRVTALFSPTHLKAGYKAARGAFAELRHGGNQGLDVMLMAVDLGLIVLSMGVLLPLLALLPGFNFSTTSRAFITGVQLSKEEALKAAEAQTQDAQAPKNTQKEPANPENTKVSTNES